MLKFDDTLRIEYLAEAGEQLANMESDLLEIQKVGASLDGERIGRIFRAVHMIKGSSGLFDLVKIGELAHRIEDVLALIRSRKLVPSADLVGILLEAVDRLRDLIDDSEASNQADIADVIDGLERVCAEDGNALEDSGTRRGNPTKPGGGNLRILLVEDDFASRLLLQTFLSRYGECHIAVNGSEAVEAFRTALDLGRSYDLVCMDIMMPGMDGREAVHNVRALEEAKGIWSAHGAKIFMTTTVNELKEVALCFRELCDAYLVKPIDLERLLGQMKLHRLVQ
jgi:two-component system, chemotaxis family, chemotaxis protein CheY